LSANSPNFEPLQIDPVPEGVHRPSWSVMIPTFNCAKYLRQTLESVLAQDPGSDQMQIEVVDDCSTKDDPESVVRELGKGRVAFYRKPQNQGATSNFNTCIQRSLGHLVHILHGDDHVLPGFYARMQAVVAMHPDCALYAARCFFADEEGYYTGVTGRLPELEKSPARNVKDFYVGAPIQFAGNVLRRTFYEQHGGFLEGLVHVADWEMWTRAVARGGGMVVPEVLGVYRMFQGNDTGRLMRTAENLKDRERLNRILSARHPDFNMVEANKRVLCLAINQESLFAKLGDKEAAAANREFWVTRSTLGFRLWNKIRRLRSGAGN
jgi:glycosyltransferase involved in cell wall biosynthesis